MAAASEEFFSSTMYCVPSGGSITRSASGITMKRLMAPRRNPTARAASICPAGTGRMPERTVSAKSGAQGAEADAHDLGDVGRAVERERDRHRDELRDDGHAAGEIEAGKRRHVP